MDERDDIEFIENDEDGSETGIQAKVKKLRDKIAALEQEKQEYLDGWQRARADYANMVKAQDEDRKRLKGALEESLVEEFIPVVDSFYSAFNNKEAWEAVDPNWRIGVEYIFQQLQNVLETHSLHAFGEVHDTFDPVQHQAVSETQTTDAALDHKIAVVLQKGFMYGSNVVRPARVSVYKLQA